MEKAKIYIDGQEGTTGLKILERFENRTDIEILKIEESKRKDSAERKKLINASDFTFLCLPDAASIEAVSFVENSKTRILDASTAHRTNPAWDYGFPELSAKHRSNIEKSSKVAVPGCYASGFISLVYPLIQAGIMPKDYPVTCFASSGYSGGGKKMIAAYESSERSSELDSTRFYALGMAHKHLPEMSYVCGLDYKPLFSPFVADYFSGMAVMIPIHTRTLEKRPKLADFQNIFEEHYQGQKLVRVTSLQGADTLEDGILFANTLSGTAGMEIFVFGNDDQVLLCSRLDNLGKGASGAAVQCMNIMMGIDETTGLV